METQKVKFKKWKCYLKYDKYQSTGNTCITLLHEKTHDSVAIATVNTVQALPKGYVLIKNYSENEGIMDCLIDANIIYPPLMSIPISPYVNAELCEIVE